MRPIPASGCSGAVHRCWNRAQSRNEPDAGDRGRQRRGTADRHGSEQHGNENSRIDDRDGQRPRHLPREHLDGRIDQIREQDREDDDLEHARQVLEYARKHPHERARAEYETEDHEASNEARASPSLV